MFQLLIALSTFTPHTMPLNVKRGSLWLGYNLKNTKVIENMIPKGFKLSTCKLLCEDTKSSKKLLYNIYNIESTFMKGTRLEVVTIVENHKGKKSFVVLDCMSNTMHWNPQQGILLPNAFGHTSLKDDCINTHFMTTRGPFIYKGRLLRKKKPRRDFVIESNDNCFFKDTQVPVALHFDEKQISQSVTVLETTHNFVIPWQFLCAERTHAFVHDFDMEYNATFMINC